MSKASKKKNKTFTEYIANQIEMCDRSQKQISMDLGYGNPNIISMFKLGLTKVPIAKIKPLAKSLGVDPVRLLKMALEEYSPETYEVIQDIFSLMPSDNERNIILELRRHLDNKDMKMNTATSRKALKTFSKTLS